MHSAGPDAVSPTLTLRRLGPVLLTILVGLVWAGLFGVVREREREQTQRDFERAADDLEVPLRTRIDGNLDVLHSIGRFYAGSKSVEADEFAQFTGPALASRPGLRALAWVPRVPATELADHVRQAEEKLHLPAGYEVHTLDGRPGQGDSFPILYVVPFEQQRSLWGLDLGSDAGSLAAMEKARDAAAPISAPPPTFAAGKGENLGYFVFLPLYGSGRPAQTLEERRENLLGFAVGALSPSHSMEASLAELKPPEIEYRLVEVGDDGQVVRQLHPPAGQEAFGSWSGPLPRPYWATSFERVGRTWRVEAMPGDGYLTLHRRWLGWSVLGAGALFTALLAAYLNNLSGRTARVEAIVVRRTEELTGANQRLQSEIVERKRAEDELKAAKEAAEDSEQRTRLIVDTAYDAFLTMDSAGATTDWNHEAEVTFGWSREEILGRPVAETLIPLRLREGHWRGLRHFLATGEGPVLGKRIELPALHRDGHEFPVEITIAAVPVAGTHLFNAFVHDITERKRAEAELRSAKDEAQAATRAKSEFLANMSHEIRTPLNGIIGMTELVLDTELTPEQQEYLDLAKSSADHLLAVINDILDFSKIEAGKLELEMLDFDLREALEDTVAMLAARAHKKGLELLDDVAADVPDALVGDLHRLRQVVVNLIGNAIKFTEQGEVVLRVERVSPLEPGAPSPDGHELHFSVRDTGIGISREQQTRLFQAFSQADTSTTRKYGGTGLGLAISARIVERMDGRMWLESDEGRGSTFHFTACFGRARAAQTRRVERAELRDLRVLVVDDNATNRRILEGMLSSWGMRPTLVDGGRAALSALDRAREEGRPFAVVLLDAMMPEMDGFTLAEQIKLGSEAGATLMMLSSAGRREDAERCRALGVAAFLGKPVRQSTLLDAILTALGPAPGEPGRAVGEEEPPSHPVHTRLRLLLAEDNAVNQRLAVSVLEKRGHEVVVAGNGREALAALDERAFDAVLMDVQMPEMDGFEATVAIRARERRSGAHIPIIAMTAHAMKGDRERCLAAGMDGYVAKPLDPKELFLALDGIAASAVPLAVFDKGAALERIGDEELFGKLVELFLDECPKQMAEIRRGITQRDGGTVERAAHNLKGAAGVFSAEAACRGAERIEAMGRDESWADAEAALRSLEDAVARLRLALTEIGRPGAPS